MLSFKSGKPIARIKGGKYNGKILYLSDSGKLKNKEIEMDDDVIEELLMKKLGRSNLSKLEILKRAVKKDIEPNDDDLLDLYFQTKEEINNNNELVLYDGKMIPIPNPKNRECTYISAPSGSGKSTYVANYAREFKKLFPKKDVFLFSKLSTDESLDKIKPTRIAIDESIVEEPIQPEELADSLVIFDDTDTIRDKKIRDSITELKNDLLETGRHEDVYVVITSHLLNNYKETRTILNECHTITIFPSSGSAHSIKYCLKNYVGLDKNQINRILRLPSRWVTIYKHYPQAVLYECGAYLIK